MSACKRKEAIGRSLVVRFERGRQRAVPHTAWRQRRGHKDGRGAQPVFSLGADAGEGGIYYVMGLTGAQELTSHYSSIGSSRLCDRVIVLFVAHVVAGSRVLVKLSLGLQDTDCSDIVGVYAERYCRGYKSTSRPESGVDSV